MQKISFYSGGEKVDAELDGAAVTIAIFTDNHDGLRFELSLSAARLLSSTLLAMLREDAYQFGAHDEDDD